jgi:hypothetical protein
MARAIILSLLLACLALGGCADKSDRSADDDRFGGFYGGISGGGAVSR